MREYAPEVWLVEDSAEDAEIFCFAAETAGLPASVRVFSDAASLAERMEDDGHAPALVFLDLNLPGRDGGNLLAELKRAAFLKRSPVLVLSSSAHRQDVRDAYDRGAAAYLVKPLGLARYEELLRSINAFWFGAVRRAE